MQPPCRSASVARGPMVIAGLLISSAATVAWALAWSWRRRRTDSSRTAGLVGRSCLRSRSASDTTPSTWRPPSTTGTALTPPADQQPDQLLVGVPSWAHTTSLVITSSTVRRILNLLLVWQRGESNPAWAPVAAPGLVPRPFPGCSPERCQAHRSRHRRRRGGHNGPRSPCRSTGPHVAACCQEAAGSGHRRGPAVVPARRGAQPVWQAKPAGPGVVLPQVPEQLATGQEVQRALGALPGPHRFSPPGEPGPRYKSCRCGGAATGSTVPRLQAPGGHPAGARSGPAQVPVARR